MRDRIGAKKKARRVAGFSMHRVATDQAALVTP
jgi:hypothetical protein